MRSSTARSSNAARRPPTRLGRRCVALALSISMASTSFAQGLPAASVGLVPTEAFVERPVSDAATQGAAARERLLALLDRVELAAALAARGVDLQQARERVAALTDEQAQRLARQLDDLPAGSSEIISTVLFVFVLLLITDILGFTKVFPFTRSVR